MPRLPKVASYHCGPYRLAAILSDPGRPGTNCGAEAAGEVGVLNYLAQASDQTACNCHAALEHAGLPLSANLPMNAVPWHGGKADEGSLQEGAAMKAAETGGTGSNASCCSDGPRKQAGVISNHCWMRMSVSPNCRNPAVAGPKLSSGA